MKRDKTFGIYVPSYKRYDCIKTDKVLNDCTYVVRESEEQLYRDAGVRKILAAPDQEIDSLPKIRQWIIDHTPEDIIVQIDDDIERFSYVNKVNMEEIPDTDALFNGLTAAGCTIYGACGAMGNIYAESGANPRNLENLCEKRLNYKYTDDTYTTAVDSGEIPRDLFLHPLGDSRQYGYGFCQWTSAGRKAGLYDLVKSKGVSIGDPDTQVEFMLKELQQSYKSVLQVLKTATSVQEASDIFLVKFEVPANTGSEVKKTRASYGEQYLKIYKDIEKEETNMSLISNSGHDENGKYSGGKAGDQTGTEWALIPWYNRPWKCVLRHVF